MTLGIFLWMILFLVLNVDEATYTVYGIFFVLPIVSTIIYIIYCKD